MMKVVILLAGEGSRLQVDVDPQSPIQTRDSHTGNFIPKPFIKLHGIPIIEWTTRSIPEFPHAMEKKVSTSKPKISPIDITFAIQEKHAMTYVPCLREIYGEDPRICLVPELKNGNLSTAVFTVSSMLYDTKKYNASEDDSILILDGDNMYDGTLLLDHIESCQLVNNFPNMLITTTPNPVTGNSEYGCYPENQSIPVSVSKPKLNKKSFESFSQNIYLREMDSIIEKPLLKDLYEIERREGQFYSFVPLVGTFWFSSMDLFISLADIILTLGRGRGANEEFYISQVPGLYATPDTFGGSVFRYETPWANMLGTIDELIKIK